MNASEVVRADPSARPSALQRALIWTVWSALLVAFSLPTYQSLADRWVDFTYSHGYLVAALAVFLLVRELRARPFGELRPSAAGLGLLLVAGAGVVAAHAATSSSAAQVLLPVAWFGAVWALAGFAAARRLLAPIAFIYFAIPWWDAINGALQAITVAVVSAWLRMAAVPAFIDGNIIHISSGIFEVAGGCSGLHYVIVASALATLSGLLHHDIWRPRLALVAVAVVLALIANWLRVFTIIVAGHLTEMQHYLIVEDHYYFGWAVFAVCMVPLFVIDRRLQRAVVSPSSAELAERFDSVAPTRASAGAGALVTLTFAALALGAVFGRVPSASEAASSARFVLELPTGVDSVVPSEWPGGTRPVFDGATIDAARWYAGSGEQLGVFVAHYAHQIEGGEVVYFANRPEGADARVVRAAHRQVGGSATSQPFAELEAVDPSGRARLVWYQFRVAGVLTDREVVAKLWQAWGAVSGRPDAQVVVLTAVCTERSCTDARSMLAARAADITTTIYRSVERSLADAAR